MHLQSHRLHPLFLPLRLCSLPMDIVYDPIELYAATDNSEEENGKHVSGPGFVQVVRYSQSPVGTYDELAILPGFFSTVGPDGQKRKGFQDQWHLGQPGGNSDE